MSAYDVIVVGGGQAGLAMGYYLRKRGLHYLILDASPEPGHVWRSRWESLKLFTPAAYSSLPGLPFPAAPDHCPSKDEAADYLKEYARRYSLNVHASEPVVRLRQVGDPARLEVESSSAIYQSKDVVVATGPFQRPNIPESARGLAPDVVQLHSSDYRLPSQIPNGHVLVVGAGNSGVQIAAELAGTHQVSLSVGAKMGRVPQSLFGRSIFWWFDKAGLLDVTVNSRIGRRARNRELLVGDSPVDLAKRLGVKIVGRVRAANGNVVETEAGEKRPVSAVVWATGYRADYSWIDADVFDAEGRPLHNRGVTSVPGLHFLGLPWQHTRGSALLGRVGADAEYLAGRIAASRSPAADRRGQVELTRV